MNLISPPPAFNDANNGALKRRNLFKSEPSNLNSVATAEEQPRKSDTEITTCLIRTKRDKRRQNSRTLTAQESAKRTKTKFEQSLVTPGQRMDAKAGKLKAQVLFESDTDSMATSSDGKSSARNRKQQPQKELTSETKFYHRRGDGGAGQNSEAGSRAKVSGDAKRGSAKLSAMLLPNWDYSLKVNRMRGNRIDSRVK